MHFILYMVLFSSRVSFSEIEFLRPPVSGGFINSFLSFFVKKEEVKSMATKLYVGGLPYSTQEDALKELFAQAGSVVSAVIIMDKMSGRSKGFGFVEMSSQDEAQKAISMFNEQEFEGRKLTVNEARPMEARPPRSGNDRGGYGGGNGGGRREY